MSIGSKEYMRRLRSTPEGRAKTNEAVRRCIAKVRSTTEGRERLNSKGRERDTKYRLGITLAEAVEVRKQPCAICGSMKKKRFVDHNHASGAVRGPLCSPCNAHLGWLERHGYVHIEQYMRRA